MLFPIASLAKTIHTSQSRDHEEVGGGESEFIYTYISFLLFIVCVCDVSVSVPPHTQINKCNFKMKKEMGPISLLFSNSALREFITPTKRKVISPTLRTFNVQKGSSTPGRQGKGANLRKALT